MTAEKIMAITLIVVGFLAVNYGDFSVVSDTPTANIDSVPSYILERVRINIPIVAGLVFIFVGEILFVVSGKFK